MNKATADMAAKSVIAFYEGDAPVFCQNPSSGFPEIPIYLPHFQQFCTTTQGTTPTFSEGIAQ